MVNFKSKTNKVPQSVVSGQGDDLYDPLTIANEFNIYFSEIGSRMGEKIPPLNGMPDHTTTLCSSFCLYDTSEEEVVRLIGNLSDDKAINENDTPTKIIKLAKFVLAPIFTHIFNKCINECFYPDCLKVAKVKPIYKSGEQRFAQIIDQYLFCCSSIKLLKGFYMTECTFIYRNTNYYPNINLVSGLDLQPHMKLRVFTPIY